ncbi:MAG TPA: acyl-CoA dehydrogenase family protein [Polyangiales bacterium]|nr:acyl-CoA dehydrogenase family protein [Polyangiales bacterium]
MNELINDASQPRATRMQALWQTVAALKVQCEERSQREYETHHFVHENLAAISDAGLTILNLPARLGGLEASLYENMQVIRHLARGCASTAFTLAIHYTFTGGMRDIAGGDDAKREQLYRTATRKMFLCGPFTDSHSGGNPLHPSTTARRTANGFVLNGVKQFFTGFDACTHMVITAALSDEDLEPPFNTLAFLIEKPASLDAEVVAEWSGIALPLTGSHSVRIHDLHVKESDLIAPVGVAPVLSVPLQSWGHYLFSAVALGLAERAFELAVERSKGRTNTALSSALTALPGVQFAVAKMQGKLQAMEALLEEYTTTHAEPGMDPLGFAAETAIPKYVVTNEAAEVVKLAFEVIGGSGLVGSTRIGQIFRDVRALSLLPLNNDLCREMIGKSLLGMDVLAKPRWL